MGWDGPHSEQCTVAEFDSAMNDFLDSIPPHLRWDPESPPQGTFFDQSAILHMTYNYILISIHRPYIQKPAILGAPSLSICASAARAIINTADIWFSKLQRVPLPSFLDPLFISAIILVLTVLRAKRAGLSMEKNKDLIQVERAMEIFKFAECRLQPVGRIWELLRELCSLDGIPFNYSPNDELYSVDGGSAGISGSFPSNSPDEYRQLGQSSDFWNSPPSSDQGSTLRPGMSIEQLLAGTDPSDAMNSILDHELMTMLMTPSTGVGNMDHWDAYIENRNNYGSDAGWSNGFGAQD